MQNFKVFLLLVAVVSALARPSSFSAEEGNRLIQVSETEPAKWLTQEQVSELIRNKAHFMDITDSNYPVAIQPSPFPKAFPSTIRFQSTVRSTFSNIDIPWMTQFVTEFSSYTNRYYNSQLGVQSSNWLRSLVSQGIASSNYRGNATVREFTHTWAQSSVIARIQGSENGVVILGAHQDSINSASPVNGVAPGADDNASGSVALLETFLILLESGIIPKQSIEFQWYAAEEVGLRGSQAIAESYQRDGVNVISMLNYDVVGYYVGIDKVSFLTDFTDRDLNAFLRLVVDEYLTYTWTNSVCGYGCSDHASWNRLGFPAASPSEAELFPYMHTTRDTISQVNFPQVAEFVKLAIGYAIELAEPST